MEKPAPAMPFKKRTAAYFVEKSKKLKGPQKLVVALEMSRYLTDAREHGLSFEELKQSGFKFATV
ncbi:MAG: hypothetical protein ABIY51_02865 [Ferruginibacter sp.]